MAYEYQSPFNAFVTGVTGGLDFYYKIAKAQSELDEIRARHEASEATPEDGTSGGYKTAKMPAGTPGEDPSSAGSATGKPGQQAQIDIGDLAQNGVGHIASKGERIAFYTELAARKKLNLEALLQTIGTEGLNKYVGDNGTSFGDFQLHLGGGSMGDQAIRAGIDPRKPETWKQQAEFATDQMVAHRGDSKWFASQWHGPRDNAPWAVANFGNPDAKYEGRSLIPSAGKPTQTAAATPAPGEQPVAAGGGSTAPAAEPAKPALLPPAFDMGPSRASQLGSAGTGALGWTPSQAAPKPKQVSALYPPQDTMEGRGGFGGFGSFGTADASSQTGPGPAIGAGIPPRGAPFGGQQYAMVPTRSTLTGTGYEEERPQTPWMTG